MRLRDEVDLTVVSERAAFTFRPNSIYVPFGADPDDLVVALDKAFDRRRVDFVRGSVTGVDPESTRSSSPADTRLVTTSW